MLDATKSQLALLLLGTFVVLMSLATFLVVFGYFPDSRVLTLITVWVVYGVSTLELKPSFSFVKVVKIVCAAAFWPYFLVMDTSKGAIFKVMCFFGFIVVPTSLLFFASVFH